MSFQNYAPTDRRTPAVFLFLIGALALAWPWLEGTVTIPWDAKAHFYPQFVFLSRALHLDSGFSWTPNAFAGSPQIADPQSLIFAPFYLAAAALARDPGFILFDGLAFAMLCMGGLGLFLYFRDRGWGAVGALAAALSFAFGGSAAWRIQHIGQIMSLAWFPLAVFALSRALSRGSFLWGLCAGVCAGLMVLGRDQVAWLQTLILTGLVVWRLFEGRSLARNALRSIAPLSGGVLAGLLVAAIPVLLTYAFAEQSNRPEITYDEVVKGSLHPAAFLTLFCANLFGVDGPLSLFWGPPTPVWGANDIYLARNMGTVYLGALPILALAATRWRGVDRDILFWLIAALLLLIYSLGRFTPGFHLLYHVPGADLWRRPADATFTLCAILSLLGGYCIQKLRADPGNWRPWRAIAFIAAGGAACLWATVDKGKTSQAADALVLASALFVMAWLALWFLARFGARRPAWTLMLLAGCLTLDLKLSNGPNESTALPSVEYDMLRPQTNNSVIEFLKARLERSGRETDRRDRVELAGLGFQWPNASLSHDFDNVLGYNPLRLSLFEAFTNAQDHVALPEQRNFSPAFPSYRSLASDLIGLRYIVTGAPVAQIDRTLKPNDLVFLGRFADGYIYENPRAFPRVFVATNAQLADFDEILKKGTWPDVDYRRTILLQDADLLERFERAKNLDSAAPPAPATAEIATYDNTEIVVRVQAPEGGWLVLNDVFHPWWIAEVDGLSTPILQANVAFRAVRLPAGAREVRLRFAPLSGFIAGLRRSVQF